MFTKAAKVEISKAAKDKRVKGWWKHENKADKANVEKVKGKKEDMPAEKRRQQAKRRRRRQQW